MVDTKDPFTNKPLRKSFKNVMKNQSSLKEFLCEMAERRKMKALTVPELSYVMTELTNKNKVSLSPENLSDFVWDVKRLLIHTRRAWKNLYKRPVNDACHTLRVVKLFIGCGA